MLRKWGIWGISIVLTIAPIIAFWIFWVALQSASDSVSDGIGEFVRSRSPSGEVRRAPETSPPAARPTPESRPAPPPPPEPQAAAEQGGEVAEPAASRPRVKPAANRTRARRETPDRATLTRPETMSPALAELDEPTMDRFQEVADMMTRPGPTSRNRLIELIRDDDPMVRALAANALAVYEDDHVLRIIRNAAERETDPSAKRDMEMLLRPTRSR